MNKNRFVAIICVLLIILVMLLEVNLFNIKDKITGKATISEGSVSLMIVAAAVCGDNICSSEENCPTDAANCTDNKCFEPTCLFGCGETTVSAGGADEACYDNIGCNGINCRCDGAGNCIQASVEQVPGPTGGPEGGGAGGGGKAGGVRKIVALDIILPSVITMYPTDNLMVPVLLRNSGTIGLDNIFLSASTNIPNIGIKLDRTYFDRIFTKGIVSANLFINTKGAILPGKITLTAVVPSIALVESASLYVDTIQKGEVDLTNLEARIAYAKDFFNENPECLELIELVRQSEGAFEIRDYVKSRDIIESSIEDCQKLLALIAKKEVEVPARPTKMYIIIGMSILFIFILIAIITYIIIRRKSIS